MSGMTDITYEAKGLSMKRSLIICASMGVSVLCSLWSAQAAAAALTLPAAVPVTLSAVAPVMSCAALTNTDLAAIGGAGSHVTSAREITGNGAQVCQVAGVLAPKIQFQVSLPMTNWQQRFLQIGCGGLCGQIPREIGAANGCAQVNDGSFVTSSTDMGHQGSDGAFGHDQQLRADFAYRGVHLTAVATKVLIKAFYGQDARFSYFSGCSDGGREAVMEAQRYPDDFNGIIAGAPAMNFLTQNGVNHPWLAQSNTGADGKPILLENKLPLIHKAVLAQCDAMDGDKDQLISNPMACHPHLQSLLCKPGSVSSNNCLTAQELAVVEKVYRGPMDPKSGKPLLAGGPLPGSELAWAGIFVPAASSDMLFSSKIGQDANDVLFTHADTPARFDLQGLKFDAAYFAKLSKLHPFYDATNPDLSAFYQHQGKLILWHGLADQHISPMNTINYHLAVQHTMGEKKAATFERLYLIPGMYHCSGGEGPNQLDLLTPMMAWVEQGRAPQAVLAKKYEQQPASGFGQPTSMKKPDAATKRPPQMVNGKLLETRPVYPFPAIAVYRGHGDKTQASSFHAVIPNTKSGMTDWLGRDFYKPYPFLN